jgi:hypothetical protein
VSSAGYDHRCRCPVNAFSGSPDRTPQTRCASYSIRMHGFLTVLVVILMLATLGVLIAGMIGLVREGDPRRSNKLMQWRVLLQGATILLFVILMSLLRS